MITSIQPIKDTTIYDYYPTKNVGLDSITEIIIDSDNSYTSRILMYFNTNDITSKSSSSALNQYVLKLFTSLAYEIPEEYTFDIFPLKYDWINGIGKFYNTPLTDNGCTWINTGYQDWLPNSGSSEFNQVSGGGVWNSDYNVSSSFNLHASPDLSFNITPIVEAWKSGSIENYGLIIKLRDEYNQTTNLDLKYFSLETHTVYEPKLEISYNDNVFISGSTIPLISDKNFVIYSPNIQYSYNQNNLNRIDIRCRPRYTEQTFRLENENLLLYHLPYNTYYSIMDGKTKDVIVDFDENFTRLHLDTTGNYMVVDMSMFSPERTYKIIFKVVYSEYEINIVEPDLFFKVVR